MTILENNPYPALTDGKYTLYQKEIPCAAINLIKFYRYYQGDRMQPYEAFCDGMNSVSPSEYLDIIDANNYAQYLFEVYKFS